MTLSDATTPSQSGPGSDSNEEVLRMREVRFLLKKSKKKKKKNQKN